MGKRKSKKFIQNLLKNRTINPNYQPVPVTPPHHRHRRTRTRPSIYTAFGQTYTQAGHLLRNPEQHGFIDAPFDDVVGDDVQPDDIRLEDAGQEVAPPDPLLEQLPFALEEGEPSLTIHRQRKANQALRWTQEILPELVAPYMKLLRNTQNLRVDPIAQFERCTCTGNTTTLEITVVKYDRIDKLHLFICDCRDKLAAVQLVERGLFPCAPLLPTLAVDIKLLDLVTRLFLRVPPNQTALASTLQEFIEARGYQMRGQDPLRKRFSNALQWYNALHHRCEGELDALIAHQREILLRAQTPLLQEPTDEEERFWTSASNPIAPRFRVEDETEQIPEGPADAPLHDDMTDESDNEEAHRRKRPRLDNCRDLRRPSEYLRARCPLCFGGNYDGGSSDGYDAIVCVDACFTQKHNKQKRDPPRRFSKSVFVPEEEVKAMEREVEVIRPRRKQPSRTAESQDLPDGFEGPLLVPSSVLNDCEESFIAADERKAKSSSKFFDCTALMGLLCRHDRVLWLVNMESSGERQHYVLALLDTLFRHLPSSFTIGLLYDIGCQLHRSCVKWGFLERYLHRISFAISIFHAFGHGWPCQLIYHPRKAKGFGLSDGEGCERFWHSISKLIPYLRVAGYHHRLYTLDTQVQHLDKQNQEHLGEWLYRKFRQAREKWEKAEYEVRKSRTSEAVLREQWALQVADQTKPLPVQSKNKGKKAVEEVIKLRETVHELEVECSRRTEVLMNLGSHDFERLEAQDRLTTSRNDLKRVEKTLRSKEKALGVEEKQRVEHLLRSPFLRARMNALAIKTRLMQRLRSRKFERDRLERSFRKTQAEQRVHHQIETSVKKKDPGIQQLARRYNKLCEEMQTCIEKGRAPQNAIAPKSIPLDGLFKLEVDDEIWQDVGLKEKDDVAEPPLWLADEDVRKGIRFLLERDRCEEELKRLQRERNAMQGWFREEWDAMQLALQASDDDNTKHMLAARKEGLLKLCTRWIADLRLMDASSNVPEWGPHTDEFARARNQRAGEIVESIQNANLEEEEDGSDGSLSDDSLEYGLLEHIDGLDIGDGDEW